MKSVSAEAINKLIADSKLLEADLFGPKVLESADGRLIYKLFRRKRWFSSALLRPYAVRFARNAERLKALGFATVNVREVSWCGALKYHLVTYEKVAGKSLRELANEEPDSIIFTELGRMIARLHSKGVYFRSLHLGNLLRNQGGQLVLIDIADMRFYHRTLSAPQRRRNFQPLLNRMDDHHLLTADMWQTLINAYASAAGIGDSLARQIADTRRESLNR